TLTAIEHFFAAGPDERFISHPRTDRPLSHALLEFLRRVYADDEEFDLDFYRKIHFDLADLDADAVRTHYEESGRYEKRAASPRALVRKLNLAIRDLPLGFFADEYLLLNPDLVAAGLSEDVTTLFGHYIQFGRNENRTIGRWQFYLDSLDLTVPTKAAPLILSDETERINVGVLVHLFSPDLWPELASFARNFEGVSRDIFVNIAD